MGINIDGEDYVTPPEAAELLGISKAAIYVRIHKKNGLLSKNPIN